jgi:hypothetical protein
VRHDWPLGRNAPLQSEGVATMTRGNAAWTLVRYAIVSVAIAACTPASPRVSSTEAMLATGSPAALAQVYYWRAKPGKLDEYDR